MDNKGANRHSVVFLLLLSLFSIVSIDARAQVKEEQASIKVEGEVTQPLKLYAADLAKMQRTTVSSKDKSGASHNYTGVPVTEILNKAGVTLGRQLRGENLAKYLLVTCSDGYQVVFSLAELDSTFTDRVVILADQMEGQPLPAGVGPFRIIVPGEKKPARSSFQVVSFTVRFAKE